MAKSSSALSSRQSRALERINNAASRAAPETLERPWIGVFLQDDLGNAKCPTPLNATDQPQCLHQVSSRHHGGGADSRQEQLQSWMRVSG